MQKTRFSKSLSLIVCTVLIAAMALIASGCADSTTTPDSSGTGAVSAADSIALGEGETQFTFTVTDAEGSVSSFIINTDRTTVGAALLELELISGEDGPYGLYVKTVNGITADYDIDGTYWCFYIDGEYAMSGVDKTDIIEGTVYSFRVEQ